MMDNRKDDSIELLFDKKSVCESDIKNETMPVKLCYLPNAQA